MKVHTQVRPYIGLQTGTGSGRREPVPSRRVRDLLLDRRLAKPIEFRLTRILVK